MTWPIALSHALHKPKQLASKIKEVNWLDERRKLITVLIAVGISLFIVRGVLQIYDVKGYAAFLGLSAILFIILDSDDE